jgi:hypothetical protein
VNIPNGGGREGGGVIFFSWNSSYCSAWESEKPFGRLHLVSRLTGEPGSARE